jgi:toxin ParE1/3/4
MPLVILRPAAENDLLNQAEYYDRKGGNALGDRFLAAAEAVFARLAVFPESGAPARLRHIRIQGFRFVPVPDFEDILIFYRFSENRVRVVRVLHGRRDLDGVLVEGTEDDDLSDLSLV